MAHEPIPPSGSDTASYVTQLLEQLGRTNDAIASSLRQGGHYGRLESVGADPVASYLMLSDLRPYAVTVEADRITVYMTLLGPGIVVPTPDAITSFIVAFDAGAYPDLVMAPNMPATCFPSLPDFEAIA